MISAKVPALAGGQLRPPLPEALILVLAPFAPLFSPRVWRHAQTLPLGALLAPGARTVTAALRGRGLSGERHCPTYQRVLNRAMGSARQGGRIVLERLVTCLGPPGAPVGLGADDTVARRSGRQITAKGAYRDAVRATKQHVLHGVGVQWGSMMLVVPGPWARRLGALPSLTARCWPAQKRGCPRPKTSVDWVRQMRPQVRRWLPGRKLVWVVDGGLAAVALALAWVKRQVVMVWRLRWEAARSHRPGPRPPGKRGPNPLPGKRHRRLQAWAERSDTPWEPVAVDGYGGQRKNLWGFSPTALWYTPRLPPVAIRDVLVGDPEGKLRLEAWFCPDVQATPLERVPWVVMRWSVEVTRAEARAHLGFETPRQWSEKAIARTSPALLALSSRVTLLALPLSQGGQIAVPVTPWSHKAEPTCADCLALVRQHLWRAQY
jgi:hypothetical protein